MQGREGAARCPLCSRNARPQKALVGRAQLRAALATPFNTEKKKERRGNQVRSYARCPRTQEPIVLMEHGRCSVNAHRLESTWPPPSDTEK